MLLTQTSSLAFDRYSRYVVGRTPNNIASALRHDSLVCFSPGRLWSSFSRSGVSCRRGSRPFLVTGGIVPQGQEWVGRLYGCLRLNPSVATSLLWLFLFLSIFVFLWQHAWQGFRTNYVWFQCRFCQQIILVSPIMVHISSLGI